MSNDEKKEELDKISKMLNDLEEIKKEIGEINKSLEDMKTESKMSFHFTYYFGILAVTLPLALNFGFRFSADKSILDLFFALLFTGYTIIAFYFSLRGKVKRYLFMK